jgi:hypothetical protein
MTTTRDQFLEIKKNYDRLLEQDLNFAGDDASWVEHGTRTDDAREAVMLAPAADLSCIREKLSILWSHMKQMEEPEEARELRYIAAIKADVTALGATPDNTLGGTEPMTATPTTLICTLAREAAQLRAEVQTAETEVANLKKNVSSLTTITYERLQKLEDFCCQADDRTAAIETYITMLQPECLADALILTAMAAQMTQSVSDESRAIRRLTANVTAYLEAATGATAATLGAGGFGDIIRPWSETAAEAREILASLQPAKAA